MPTLGVSNKLEWFLRLPELSCFIKIKEHSDPLRDLNKAFKHIFLGNTKSGTEMLVKQTYEGWIMLLQKWKWKWHRFKIGSQRIQFMFKLTLKIKEKIL